MVPGTAHGVRVDRKRRALTRMAEDLLGALERGRLPIGPVCREGPQSGNDSEALCVRTWPATSHLASHGLVGTSLLEEALAMGIVERLCKVMLGLPFDNC
jgi:hypothetical protein